MIAMDNYFRLEQSVKEKERKAAEARGATLSWERQLKDKFGCESESAGKRKLAKLSRKRQKASGKYLILKDKFVKEFGNRLKEIDDEA